MTLIPVQWTANIANDTKAKDAFTELLLNSSKILERLKEIVEEKEASITKWETTISSYKEEGWPFVQSHMNGRRAELLELKKLLNIGQ